MAVKEEGLAPGEGGGVVPRGAQEVVELPLELDGVPDVQDALAVLAREPGDA